MKYDCKFISELINIYEKNPKGNKESSRIDCVINSHLEECDLCRKLYHGLICLNIPYNLSCQERESPLAGSKGIKQYRIYQIIVFFISVVMMLSFYLPWFGYKGVTEINGLIILQHPVPLLGIMIFVFAIWYPFKRKNIRLVIGLIGLCSLLLFEILEFLSIGSSTSGIQINSFSYDIMSFSGIDLTRSFNYALPGFYLGLGSLVITIISFVVFVLKSDVALYAKNQSEQIK